jgi:hypothetical protein
MAVASRGNGRGLLYVDADASEKQRALLTRIAKWILSFDGTSVVTVLTAPIRLEILENRSIGLVVGEQITVKAHSLIGNDGKSSIVVTNPWLFGSFPIRSSRKGITERLEVRSPQFSFQYYGTNANQAAFDFAASDLP